MKKTCTRCGAEFDPPKVGGGKAEYCVECKVTVYEENQKEYQQRRFQKRHKYKK